MISPEHSTCRKCGKGVCFRVDVSRLEEGMGHEKFKCDKCGQCYKIIKGDVHEVR